MFAIGVVMIGLLGVAVLIPVAGRMASDAQLIDRAARVGLNSVAEVELSGMAQPRRWVHLTDGVNVDGDMQTDEYDEIRIGGVVPALSGFCLDPRFTAANGWTINAQADSRFFPYVAVDPSNDPSAMRMRRITIAPGFGIDGADNDGDGSIDEPDEFNIGIPLADERFVCQDDLEIDTPQDPLVPAQQAFGEYADKRQFEGRVSWFATIAPHGVETSLYTLSIVVVLNRDSAMPMNGVTERVAWIPHQANNAGTITQTGFYGGGISGGDVAMTHRSSSSTPPGTPDDLTVRRGEWVMLARNSSSGPMFRWYKVLEADAELGNSSEFAGSSPTAGQSIRHMTLFGADWTPDTNPNNQTLVYIMPGVVAVFEKTIRLENSSLWTP